MQINTSKQVAKVVDGVPRAQARICQIPKLLFFPPWENISAIPFPGDASSVVQRARWYFICPLLLPQHHQLVDGASIRDLTTDADRMASGLLLWRNTGIDLYQG